MYYHTMQVVTTLILALFLVILSTGVHSELATHFNSSTPFIIAECDAGLSNRLRTMFAHAFLAQFLHGNAHLLMVWDVNDACPGHFLQYFQPIENITFITNRTRHLFEPFAVRVYPNSRLTFTQTLYLYDIDLYLPKRYWFHTEMKHWRMLQLTREMNERLVPFVRKHNVCNASAAHIRMTDMDGILQRKRRFNINSLRYWLDRLPTERRVFIMADNPDAQAELLNAYGPEKIFIYAPVPNITGNVSQLSSEFRYTSLEHTVMDIYIAAHATQFRPAGFSSISEFVRTINALHWKDWCY